jgi:hypothetical protein
MTGKYTRDVTKVRGYKNMKIPKVSGVFIPKQERDARGLPPIRRNYQVLVQGTFTNEKTGQVIRNVTGFSYSVTKPSPDELEQMRQSAIRDCQAQIGGSNWYLSRLEDEYLMVNRLVLKGRKPRKLDTDKWKYPPGYRHPVKPVKTLSPKTQKVGEYHYYLENPRLKHWREIETGRVYSNGQYVRNIKRGKEAKPLNE